MNGSRSTFMRKGYLLTALAAAVLLAASSGTAYAQRVTIGFEGTSGMISEKAYLNAATQEDPQMITVRVSGLASGPLRGGDIGSSLGMLTIQANKDINLAIASVTGGYSVQEPTQDYVPRADSDTPAQHEVYTLSGVAETESPFNFADELVLFVSQSDAGEKDDNWLGEKIELQMEVTGTASVSPDIYTLQVVDHDTAPVAKFGQRDFTLSEQSERTVTLDVGKERGVADLPASVLPLTDTISVRVSNPGAVTFAEMCPGRSDLANYNKRRYRIDPDDDGWAAVDEAAFANTGLLTTELTIGALATNEGGAVTADLLIEGCGDGAGIRDPQITLTILPGAGLNESPIGRVRGDITIGAPLTISIDSDEPVPTLSFSPTDVEIDEGGSTSTVLLAEGSNTNDVGMVKLSVEGDAMVSLMQDGEMLEEMDGHVYVDLDGNSSVRLTAMSHSDPDLMDGDMAFKAWKLMEGGTDGAMIGEGYWFKVDVRGSTAVPALPLVGQLLLALFLMAGGARLYRRRQG